MCARIPKHPCIRTRLGNFAPKIRNFVQAGGEKVEFTGEEMERIKTFGEPSLVLLGFKPLHRLKVYHNVRSSYFVYPDDERVENSSKFFHGLIEVLTKKKKFGLVRFIAKKGARVRFAALLPQKE